MTDLPLKPRPPTRYGQPTADVPFDVWSPWHGPVGSNVLTSPFDATMDPNSVIHPDPMIVQDRERAAALLDALHGGRKTMTERELLHALMGAEY